MLTTAESQITEAFSAHAPIERVKKIRDYAFIHFHTRNGALTAMEAMNGQLVFSLSLSLSLTLLPPSLKVLHLMGPLLKSL